MFLAVFQNLATTTSDRFSQIIPHAYTFSWSISKMFPFQNKTKKSGLKLGTHAGIKCWLGFRTIIQPKSVKSPDWCKDHQASTWSSRDGLLTMPKPSIGHALKETVGWHTLSSLSVTATLANLGCLWAHAYRTSWIALFSECFEQ